jgi:hypothetical protein
MSQIHIKGKVFQPHAMKAFGGTGVIAALIFNLDSRRG